MLPKQTVPEGSRKVLDGVEVYTRRNFTTERGNFFQTMNGDFILPNGKPVEDISILESLSEPQRSEALAWWDQRFLGTQKDTKVEGIPPTERKMTKEELRAKARFLLEQADEMEDEEVPEESPEPPEPLLPASGRGGQPKDTRESKRVSVKPKNDKETDVLSQMGLGS